MHQPLRDYVPCGRHTPTCAELEETEHKDTTADSAMCVRVNFKHKCEMKEMRWGNGYQMVPSAVYCCFTLFRTVKHPAEHCFGRKTLTKSQNHELSALLEC